MQQSLFGEPVELKSKTKVKVEVEEEYEDEDEDDSNEESDEDELVTPTIIEDYPQHSELYNWKKACEDAKESVAYMKFDYHTNLADEWITSEDVLERYWKGVEKGYGGHWGSGGRALKKDIIELRQEIIDWAKDLLDMPYCRERADDWAIRGIRKENIRVFFSDQCKEFIQRQGGWSVEDLEKEISELPEAKLTQELLDALEEYHRVGKTYDDARHKHDDLRRKFVDLSDGMNRLISPEGVAQLYTEMVTAKKLQIESDLRRQQLQKEIGHYR